MLTVLEKVEDKEVVLKNAKELALDQIDSESSYSITKTSSKNHSPYGYDDGRTFVTGQVFLVGDQKYVWLYVLGHGLYAWFSTSPIVKCTKIGNDFEVETHNSIYFLEKAE